jgi:transposase
MDDINDDAKGSYRRVEVLTGPDRRRRWSADEKSRIVAESLVPGAVVSQVARRWQICRQQIFAWRRELATQIGVLVTVMQKAPLSKPLKYHDKSHKKSVTP